MSHWVRNPFLATLFGNSWQIQYAPLVISQDCIFSINVNNIFPLFLRTFTFFILYYYAICYSYPLGYLPIPHQKGCIFSRAASLGWTYTTPRAAGGNITEIGSRWNLLGITLMAFQAWPCSDMIPQPLIKVGQYRSCSRQKVQAC